MEEAKLICSDATPDNAAWFFKKERVHLKVQDFGWLLLCVPTIQDCWLVANLPSFLFNKYYLYELIAFTAPSESFFLTKLSKITMMQDYSAFRTTDFLMMSLEGGFIYLHVQESGALWRNQISFFGPHFQYQPHLCLVLSSYAVLLYYHSSMQIF